MLTLFAMLLAPVPQDACPLGAAWGTRPADGGTRNTLSMVDGPLSWNGAPVSDKVLRQYFAIAARMSPRPGLVLDTAGMDCSTRRRIAAQVEAAGGCTPDLCRAYDVVRAPPPPAPAAFVGDRGRRRR